MNALTYNAFPRCDTTARLCRLLGNRLSFSIQSEWRWDNGYIEISKLRISQSITRPARKPCSVVSVVWQICIFQLVLNAIMYVILPCTSELPQMAAFRSRPASQGRYSQFFGFWMKHYSISFGSNAVAEEILQQHKYLLNWVELFGNASIVK